jgi:hypothetical protein
MSSECNVEQKEQWIFILWRVCRKRYESGIVIIMKANIGRAMGEIWSRRLHRGVCVGVEDVWWILK